MFWPDVVALKEFYSTSLGQIACHMVRRQIQKFWFHGVKGDSVLGIGFSTPYLSGLLDEALAVYACMPAAQGVVHWPLGKRNLSFLADESELPFADNSINRVLAVHALENSEQMRQMISELWRVLSPAGRLLVIVPNRRGIWARSPQSPFAHGQPFSTWQLRQLLSEHSFTPLNASSALFFPPSTRRAILRSSRFWEGLGRQFFPGFGGVLIMEAEKQIYAPAAKKIRSHGKRAYVPVVQPAGI